MKIIKKVSKKELQEFLYNLDLRDDNIYKELREENTLGVFQFNGALASGITKKVKPENFDEMIAINSLARPGTSSFVEDYISGKKDGSKRYPDIVHNLLSDTYGLSLFQEQLMSIFHIIGGFSLEETNDIRGLMKKLGKADKSESDIKKWDEAVKKFTKGAVENGLTDSEAGAISEDLLNMSSYQFNKSHATAYSYVAAMTLYLSHYFKQYFLSAVLQEELDGGKEVMDKIQSIRSQGLDVLPPDINKSMPVVAPMKDGNLLLGLRNIKKVSETSAAHIVERRPYNNLFDFISKTDGKTVRVDVIKALVSVGAFDFESPERKRMLLAVDIFWKNKKSIKVKEKLEAIWDKSYKEAMQLKGLNIEKNDLKYFENEYLGGNFFTSSFSNNLLQGFLELKKKNIVYYSLSDTTSLPKKVPVYITALRNHVDKNGNEMAFITVEDAVGKTERFPIFFSYWKHLKDVIEVDKAYFIQVFLSDEGNRFGMPQWTDDKRRILRMVKPIPTDD